LRHSCFLIESKSLHQLRQGENQACLHSIVRFTIQHIADDDGSDELAAWIVPFANRFTDVAGDFERGIFKFWIRSNFAPARHHCHRSEKGNRSTVACRASSSALVCVLGVRKHLREIKEQSIERTDLHEHE